MGSRYQVAPPRPAAARAAEATDLRYTSEQILADARALYAKRDLPRLLD